MRPEDRNQAAHHLFGSPRVVVKGVVGFHHSLLLPLGRRAHPGNGSKISILRLLRQERVEAAAQRGETASQHISGRQPELPAWRLATSHLSPTIRRSRAEPSWNLCSAELFLLFRTIDPSCWSFILTADC